MCMYISIHITKESVCISGSVRSGSSNDVTCDPTSYRLSALPFAKRASSSVSTPCPSSSRATLDSSLRVSRWLQQFQTSQLHATLSSGKKGVPSNSSYPIWDMTSRCLSLGCIDWIRLINGLQFSHLQQTFECVLCSRHYVTLYTHYHS